MRTLVTIAAVAALGWLPAVTPAAAQDRPRYPFAAPRGMIHTEDGWREPTVTEALEAIERKREAGDPIWLSPDDPAVAVLRQTFGPLTAAELDAFADRLAGMMTDTTLPEHVRGNAGLALTDAATPDSSYVPFGEDFTVRPFEGTPYARAFDLLVLAYEGGYGDALHSLFIADPERGPAYVRDVLERGERERPPLCRSYYGYDGQLLFAAPEAATAACDDYIFWDARESPWCEAGDLLYRRIVVKAIDREWGGAVVSPAGAPRPVPPGLPEHVEDWHRRCL